MKGQPFGSETPRVHFLSRSFLFTNMSFAEQMDEKAGVLDLLV